MARETRIVIVRLTEDEALELLSRCMCSTSEDSPLSDSALRNLAKAIQLEDDRLAA